jgi:glycosyltransferase involved in cell wall biosynthesis
MVECCNLAIAHENLTRLSIQKPLEIAIEHAINVDESNVIKSQHMVSVIVPVYNEDSNISRLLTHIKDILRHTLLDYEVIIVNDGSTDNTLKILVKEEKLDENIKVVSYSANSGKGYAVRQGILNSKGDMVLFLDGDLDISPNEIKKYIKELEGFDLVIASKAHPESNVKSPSHRKLLSKMYSFLVRLVVGIKVKDTQSGLKIGNGDVLRRIFEVMLVKGYAFDVELLALATRFNLKIGELPINITLNSSFKIREIVKMFIDTLGISYRLRITRSYEKYIESVSLFQKIPVPSN